MARDQVEVVCPAGVWTEISNSDVTTVTFQARKAAVAIRATVGAVPPATLDLPGKVYKELEGENRVAIGVLAAAVGVTRLYAIPINSADAAVYIDHA